MIEKAKLADKLIKHKLLVGQYIGPDYSQKSVEVKDALGNVTKRRPSKKYTVEGSKQPVIYSETDLQERFGSQKFLRVTPKSKAKNVEEEGGVIREDDDEDTGHMQPVGKVSNGMEKNEVEEVEGDDTKDNSVKNKQRSLDNLYGKLDDMTKSQLEKIAESEEVDVSECHTKTSILKALRDYEKAR